MKKIIAFLLALSLICAIGCKKQPNDNVSNFSTFESTVIQADDQAVSTVDGESANSNSELTGGSEAQNSNEEILSEAVGTNSDIDNSSKVTESTDGQSGSYRDIACTTVTEFKQVGFSVKNCNTMLSITMPKDWQLVKSGAGYTIIKNSQHIGDVSTSLNTPAGAENVFSSNVTANGINVYHYIDSVVTNGTPSYIRTLRYDFTDEKGNAKNIYLSVSYQEMDSSATYKMLTEVSSAISSTSSNLGILQIQDNRNKILILGNSFIGSSRIGNILQTMCGNDVRVDARAMGYAHVESWTSQFDVMKEIRDGSYSVVFICGLYSQESLNALQEMVNACNQSNTKLAVFPAHNESRPKIEHALSMYPNTVFLDWKAEIDALISKGIDVSNFCIPDEHKHSTPLAGYVGAHMIYRAVFNQIPQCTQFSDVSIQQIELLGEYVLTGTVSLLDDSSVYVIE